jgi:preflagellin peptidase FlaK
MIENIALLDIFRFIIGTIILTYASYTDLKTRKASNILWLIMGLFGVLFLIIQYFLIGSIDFYYLIFIPIMIILIYIFFQLRLIFGGADAKAIMALAILVPLKPSIFIFPLWDSFMPYSWVIFSNSVLLFLLIPIFLLLFNIIHKDFKFPYFFLGYRMNVDEAKEKFVWPLEKIVNGKRKFSYLPRGFNSNSDYEIFKKNGINEIWVTPKTPFMIPLLAGFITSFILGDILFYIMTQIV